MCFSVFILSHKHRKDAQGFSYLCPHWQSHWKEYQREMQNWIPGVWKWKETIEHFIKIDSQYICVWLTEMLFWNQRSRIPSNNKILHLFWFASQPHIFKLTHSPRGERQMQQAALEAVNTEYKLLAPCLARLHVESPRKTGRHWQHENCFSAHAEIPFSDSPPLAFLLISLHSQFSNKQ